jgi:archaellum component FlaC
VAMSNEQLEVDGGDPAADDQRLADFCDSARALLAGQRDRIRDVEATLQQHTEELLELVRSHEAEAAQSQRDLSEERARLARHRTEIAASYDLLAAKTTELESLASRGSSGSGEELTELLEEIDRLERELDDLKRQLEAVGQDAPTGSGNSDAQELRERFEMAVQEIRELKVRNEKLNAENISLSAQPGRSADPPDGDASNGFDWETQKQALLREMEADLDSSDPGHAHTRLTIEGAIQITDQVVAEKDTEIAELQSLLANQSSSLGDLAVGAAAIAEVLDHDELVHQERENLIRMQDEWREKLRQAEVEISVERAKFARDRIELDDKSRLLEQDRTAIQQNAGNPSSEKKPRGNWLGRLGLKDDS